MAWRKHFDSDGDAELDFKEICEILGGIDRGFQLAMGIPQNNPKHMEFIREKSVKMDDDWGGTPISGIPHMEICHQTRGKNNGNPQKRGLDKDTVRLYCG